MLIDRSTRIYTCSWSLIAGRLPGRTAKEVESFWNRHMRSKLKYCTGLDPEKHHTTTFPLLPDVQQCRRRPRNTCKVGRPDAKHPDRPPSSNAKVEEDVVDDCASDAGSACWARQDQLPRSLDLLDLTLATTPCLWFGENEQIHKQVATHAKQCVGKSSYVTTTELVFATPFSPPVSNGIVRWCSKPVVKTPHEPEIQTH